MKKCPRCGESKKAAGFYKNKRNKNGLSDWCKTCHSEYNKQVCAEWETEAGELGGKNTAVCPTCGMEFEPSAQRPKLNGVMYCSLDCLLLEDGQEEHSGKDPKSRYYNQGGLEVLDVIRAKLTPEQWRGYLLGNLIKYSCRANWKGDFKRDAEKM
ncbi:MAG: DUF3310 domain-containing protein, partial [Desulfosalsimonas sp.]